jgi:hypothetical protein
MTIVPIGGKKPIGFRGKNAETSPTRAAGGLKNEAKVKP